MLLRAKARLKAGRWPSRSVSASTPSQSKRIASRVAVRDVVGLSEDATTRPPSKNWPLFKTNADDEEKMEIKRVNFIILYHGINDLLFTAPKYL